MSSTEKFKLLKNEDGDGLFMHFCDSNHNVARMQQRKNNITPEIKFILMKILKNKNLKVNKLMIVFSHVRIMKGWRKTIMVNFSASPVASINKFLNAVFRCSERK